MNEPARRPEGEVEPAPAGPDRRTPSEISRRDFLAQALAATSGAALAGAVPTLLLPAPLAAQGGSCPTETLQKIGEIASRGSGTMKGVLMIKNARKRLPGYTGSQLPMMRYFAGYDQQAPGIPAWPPAADRCYPGPTLRVRVGERVELTFLNQVDVGAFPGLSLDNAETGATDGCDLATNATVDPPDRTWYPVTRGDTFPNCFHASSTANLHFHGTHVTPDGFGDNVLVQIRPDPSITEDQVRRAFDEIFAACRQQQGPPKWAAVPASYRDAQATAVANYDLHAIWKGTRGPVIDPVTGRPVPALPEANQLAPANRKAIDAGQWPQYFIGAYPSCFRVTEESGHVMGQAPGTHWYHAHKHGSTSINLFNGLAGALIIEGQYDEDLKKALPRVQQTEKLLVVQVFTDQPDLQRVNPGTKATTTNGGEVVAADSDKGTPQKAPTIVMRPGEIQLWRIVNATVQATIGGGFTGPAGRPTAPLPAFRQIAQDGVQLSYANYQAQPLTKPDGSGNGTTFSLAPGGRIDLLVKAPAIPAGSRQSFELPGIVNLTVCGQPLDDPWPAAHNYPTFPGFLGDIGRCRLTRTVSFGWEPFRLKAGPAGSGTHGKPLPFTVPAGGKTITIATNRAPFWTIDGEQFSEHRYHQTMVLGTQEEWTLLNTTTVPHPFHIHVNPFQVVELKDPNNPGNSFVRETGGVWQDVVMIPAAQTDADGALLIDGAGNATNPGMVRIRSKFVDFPGSFVLHCHILAHEDRGMMQLVRVVDGTTTLQHH